MQEHMPRDVADQLGKDHYSVFISRRDVPEPQIIRFKDYATAAYAAYMLSKQAYEGSTPIKYAYIRWWW